MFVIKDTKSGMYFHGSGRGDQSWQDYAFSSSLRNARTYAAKGPATTFCNQYKQKFPGHRELIVVEVELTMKEVG